MCMAVPGILRSRDGAAGHVEIDGLEHVVALHFLPEAAPGDWVLVGLGVALRVLPETEAHQLREALRELSQVDIGITPPAPPPHPRYGGLP